MTDEHKHYTEIPNDGWDCATDAVRVELGWSAGDPPIQVDTEGRVIWAPAVDELRAERDRLADARGEERLKCNHKPDPCWTCQLEKSNRELYDENTRLKQSLREADEQCHQQVADAVRSRDAAWARCRELEKEKDDALLLVGAERSMHEEARARHFQAMRGKQLELDHARLVARQLFDWLDYEETSPMTRGEFLQHISKANPWLLEPDP